MFRKNSEARAEWSEEHVKSCAERQLLILNSAKKCSERRWSNGVFDLHFSEEENEGVITRF